MCVFCPITIITGFLAGSAVLCRSPLHTSAVAELNYHLLCLFVCSLSLFDCLLFLFVLFVVCFDAVVPLCVLFACVVFWRSPLCFVLLLFCCAAVTLVFNVCCLSVDVVCVCLLLSGCVLSWLLLMALCLFC